MKLLFAESLEIDGSQWSQLVTYLDSISTQLNTSYNYEVYLTHGVWFFAGMFFCFCLLWVHGR